MVYLIGLIKEPILVTVEKDDGCCWHVVDEDGGRMIVNKYGKTLLPCPTTETRERA